MNVARHRQRHQSSSVEKRLLGKHVELTNEVRDNEEVMRGFSKYTVDELSEKSRMCKDMRETERKWTGFNFMRDMFMNNSVSWNKLHLTQPKRFRLLKCNLPSSKRSSG